MLKSKLLLLVIILCINTAFVSAAIEQDHIIINSKDWRDVYSSFLYSELNGKTAKFLLNPAYGTILLRSFPRTSKVLAISSNDEPYIKGFKTIMDTAGYEGEEIILSNANFELAQELDGNITNFIIIDDTYGYNAISVASYAVVSKSYVLFANDINIEDIVDYLGSRTVESLIIFGQVDREVKDELFTFNPEIINVGDRFDNNMVIVDKYLEYKDTKQAILTNGEFIEESIMGGENPVIFIGKNNVPDSVRDYIKASNFEVGVLIGNELVGPATFIRRQLGISVFVKFAQGARNPSGGIAEVEDLDRFPMPNYQVELSVVDLRYNIATRQLEVTYQNERDLAAYFKSTITVTIDSTEIVIGDENPVFLDGNEIKTIGYSLEFDTPPENARASLYVLFGEAPKSLEFAYQLEKEIDIVDILDESEIDIKSVVYDKLRKRFEIEVENLKNLDTYASAEVLDLLINDEYKSYASDKVVRLASFETKKLYVKTPDFTDIDFENNNFVRVRSFYGQRERSLIKVFEGEYEFIIARGEFLMYAFIIIIVVLLLLTFILSKKCQHCKHSNLPTAKKCRKCGNRL